MNRDDAEEYTQALAQVGAGWWRQIAWGINQGVPEALGLSLEDWRTKRLGGLVLGSIPERRNAVAELTADGLTKSEIATVLGVDERTVQRDRNPKPEGETIVSSSGEEYQVNEPPGETIVSPGPKPVAVEPDPQPHTHVVADGDCECGWQPPTEPADASQVNPAPRVQVNEGDEWYTPRWLFVALGINFAIDVCAPLDRTFSSVPAERAFTIEDDGLAQPWHGTVWCNPPYSKPEPWARRMIHHGDGLLLTHIPMNAGWCVDVWETCNAIRLFQAMEFVRPDGTSQRPGYWLQLAAFGPVATEALSRLQPLGDAAANKRRVASPMWQRVA